MTASTEFIELVKELLAPLGPIMVRRMFGGAGVYCDAVVFAFIDDDTLFLKTDVLGRAAFLAEGMGPVHLHDKGGSRHAHELLACARSLARRAGRDCSLGVAAHSQRRGSNHGRRLRRRGRSPVGRNRGQGLGARRRRRIAECQSLATLTGRAGLLRKAGTLSANPAVAA